MGAYSTYFTNDRRDVRQIAELKRSVFVEEKNDARYDELIKNDAQYGPSNQLVVKDRDEGVIATMRLTYRKERAFKADEYYQFDRLAAFLGCDLPYLMQRVALIDRVAIKQCHRGGRVFVSMCREIAKKCRRDDMRYIVGAWTSMDDSLAAIWSRIGGRQYAVGSHDGWQGALGVYDMAQRNKMLGPVGKN